MGLNYSKQSDVRWITMLGASLLVVLLLTSDVISITPQERFNERLEELRRDLEAGDLVISYVTAKRLAREIAGKVAREAIEEICKSYARSDESYHGSPEYNKLTSVASDAWPVLEEEWFRILRGPSSRDRELKKRILIDCWHVTKEIRALGSLVQEALDRDGISGIHTVEYISGVYQGGIVVEMTPEQIRECRERFAEWWRAYRKKWKAEMEFRKKLDPCRNKN